jgi:xanthine dehydrogenase accessory factor
MYDIAVTVAACLRAGTRVDVGWVADVRGFSSRNAAEALAVTPGGGRVGSVMSGALDEQLAWSISETLSDGAGGRLVELSVNEFEAALAGLSCGGVARCLLVPATDLPAQLWPALIQRDPVCLITEIDGNWVGATEMFTPATVNEAGPDVAQLFARGAPETVVREGSVVTALWPVPKFVIVGAGAVADALDAAVRLLGWAPQTLFEAGAATAAISGLAAVDGVVVTSHDRDVAGPALAGALASRVGYIGALGSRRTQQDRADWLADHAILDLDRIHGPAGLNLGANTPAEIAVSIIAEMLATKSGRNPGSLRDSTGPIR